MRSGYNHTTLPPDPDDPRPPVNRLLLDLRNISDHFHWRGKLIRLCHFWVNMDDTLLSLLWDFSEATPEELAHGRRVMGKIISTYEKGTPDND